MAPIDLIAQLFAGEGVCSYLGEEVSLATHMLQAAALAERSGASEHLVAAALLHDVGHFEAVGRGDHRHEDSGADWLAQCFSYEVTEPVRLHVMAKRYLCAVEPGYAASLSPASVHSLALQGGPLTAAEAEAFTKLPYALHAVAVRRWDEAAKDPTVTVPPFEHFRSLLDKTATWGFEVNGRTYRAPTKPTVVFTVDGGDPRYFDDALDRGLMPVLRSLLSDGGTYVRGLGHMPSLTNPNNVSIVSSAPPSVHGIAGNHYSGPDNHEVQLTDPSLLRAPTIHAALQASGAKVLAVSAKEKLRCLLGAGDVPSISAEEADRHALPAYEIQDVAALVGRRQPGIYDWELSAYAMEIGLAVHREVDLELLGSFAWVNLPAADLACARETLTDLVGIEEVYTREEAAVIYQHPLDRIGDLSVAANASTALGTSEGKHNLSHLGDGLRSHGGRHEQIVPIIVSHPLQSRYADWLHSGIQNSDLHDLLLNGLATVNP